MFKNVRQYLNNFKQFLLRGNVVDLAVAVAVGGAFTAVVNALVKDIITPLIAAVGGKPDFSKMSFSVHNSAFLYGDFLNTLITFLLEATVIYFLIVVPVNRLVAAMHHDPTPSPTTRHCPECLSEIPMEATRCRFCTTKVKAEKVPANVQ